MQEENNSTDIINVDDIDNAPDQVPPSEKDVPLDSDKLLKTISELSFKLDEKNKEILKLERKFKTSEILDSLIKPFAEKAFQFMCWYSGIVGFLIFLHGSDAFKFSLPSGVLEFLVGSTAVTVIGLVGMVLTGIFVGARK